MIAVETIQEWREGRIKENDGGSELKFEIFVIFQEHM
jgi:hypothetical protein